jgi:prepilin-type N-terminal cleavage/methylation domain-containing protein
MFRSRNRRGLTLIELMIATSIMAIMAGVLGALALSVQMHSRHSQGYGEAVQHARVVLDRMQRTMHEAQTSPSFPGFHVVADTYGTYKLPDTIVVWKPLTAPVDPKGMPRWNEVVVFAPRPTSPNILLEIRNPNDSRVVPPLSDTTAWRNELTALKASNSAEVVELTPLLRTANIATVGVPRLHAAIRFDTLTRPDDTQWQQYKAGTRSWENIDWVQSIYGTKTGLRQHWCRIELQLLPGLDADLDDTTGQSALTFFGSAAVYQKMPHD